MTLVLRSRIALLLLFASGSEAGPIRVACVGDSITAGYMASNASMAYPGRLQALLTSRFGKGSYNVTNFGAGGATVQRHADSPYWNRTQFDQFIKGTYDVIIIMLGTIIEHCWSSGFTKLGHAGTNGAKSDRSECSDRVGPMRYDCTANWPAACSAPNATAESCSVVEDYISLIELSRTLLATNSNSLLTIMTPPPLWKDAAYGMSASILNDIMPDLTAHIARLANLQAPLDIYSALGGTPSWRKTFPACGCQRPPERVSSAGVPLLDGGGVANYTGTQRFLAVGGVIEWRNLTWSQAAAVCAADEIEGNRTQGELLQKKGGDKSVNTGVLMTVLTTICIRKLVTSTI